MRFILYLSWYLLQMTILGKSARLIGSVEETRLVDTVEVVNCSTVLGRGVVRWWVDHPWLWVVGGWCYLLKVK